MLRYVLRRFAVTPPLLVAISILTFIIIQLPPGDYLTTYIQSLQQSGTAVDSATIATLTHAYGLDQPVPVQYLVWIRNILMDNNWGYSFQYNQPVSALIGQRLPATLALSTLSLLFVWAVSLPVGIYSATHKYTVTDYAVNFVGFIGLAVPPFLLALVAIFAAFVTFGVPLTGLFSPAYVDAPWSMARFVDMMPRLSLAVIVVGLSSTAGLIRITRGLVSDEIAKQYVTTARSKGLREERLLLKYPVRVAITPLISTIGWTLPALISGEAVVSIVLNLPTTGMLLLNALLAQDMYLAGGILLILSALTVLGTLISDVLLAVVDPRVRYKRVTA